VVNKLKEYLGPCIYKRKSIENVSNIQNQIWILLKEMEEDMKNWMNDKDLEVPEIIKKEGREVEIHQAETDDGYILTLHRIPPIDGAHGHPVYLQHGLLGSSACWVTTGPKSLAFILNDAGYDVWMGNFRGNGYGRNHRHMDPDKDKEFWKFTLHEHALYDLPASLKVCLNVSDRKKLSYVGHSMGTTTFLAMCSNNTSFATKIDIGILLAPVVEPSSMTNPIKHIAPVYQHVQTGLEYFGILEFLPEWTFAKKIITAPWMQFIYAVFLRKKFSFEGTEVMKMITNTFKNGKSSVYIGYHFSQMINNKAFCAYNWQAKDENISRYSISDPPQYLLNKIKVPVVLFWSEVDTLSSQSGVEILKRELPNLKMIHKTSFHHIDYMWGEHIDTLLNKPICDILNTVAL